MVQAKPVANKDNAQSVKPKTIVQTKKLKSKIQLNSRKLNRQFLNHQCLVQWFVREIILFASKQGMPKPSVKKRGNKLNAKKQNENSKQNQSQNQNAPKPQKKERSNKNAM